MYVCLLRKMQLRNRRPPHPENINERNRLQKEEPMGLQMPTMRKENTNNRLKL